MMFSGRLHKLLWFVVEDAKRSKRSCANLRTLATKQNRALFAHLHDAPSFDMSESVKCISRPRWRL